VLDPERQLLQEEVDELDGGLLTQAPTGVPNIGIDREGSAVVQIVPDFARSNSLSSETPCASPCYPDVSREHHLIPT